MSRISTDVEYHKSAEIFLLLKIKHQEHSGDIIWRRASFSFKFQAKDIYYTSNTRIYKKYRFFVLLEDKYAENE